MIAVLLALLGAASYGVSDFVGGMFGKRASAVGGRRHRRRRRRGRVDASSR